MNAKDILTSIIASLGITPAEFSRSLFLPARSERVQKVLSGRTAHISRGFAALIKKYYPQFNLNYIVNGIGDMYVDERESVPHVSSVPEDVYFPKYALECIYQCYNLNANRLALLCGIHRSVFANTANPVTPPQHISERNANLIIANVDHGLSLTWLMYGTGPMYTDGREDFVPDAIQDRHLTDPDPDDIESMTNEQLLKRVVEMQRQLKNITDLIHQKGVNYHDRAAEPQPEEDK